MGQRSRVVRGTAAYCEYAEGVTERGEIEEGQEHGEVAVTLQVGAGGRTAACAVATWGFSAYPASWAASTSPELVPGHVARVRASGETPEAALAALRREAQRYGFADGEGLDEAIADAVGHLGHLEDDDLDDDDEDSQGLSL